MKIVLPALLLSLLLLACSSCSDYPHHEPPLTDCDNHLTGPGLYGGIESPTNNNPTSNPSAPPAS
jgi:hypothetical protein